MCIFRLKTVAMVNDDKVSVAAGIFGARNFALGLDLDFVAGAAGKIHALMTGAFAVKRIGTRAVLRRYPIAPNRFADGNILNDFLIVFQIVVTFENLGDLVVKFLVLTKLRRSGI